MCLLDSSVIVWVMEDWSRLADHVIAARVRLGYKNRRAFAAYLRDIGHPVTERTLGSLERGERVSMDTVAAVGIGLGWEPGSGRATLEGGEPTTRATSSEQASGRPEPEILPGVTRESTQDWEWEIWEKLTLTSAEDKSLMIEYLKFMRDRAAMAEGSGQGRQRQTG